MPEHLYPILLASALTFAMAVLRLLVDGIVRQASRIFIEALYCVGLGQTAFFVVLAMGMNLYWGLASALLIGHLGSVYTRIIFRTLLLRKLQIEDIQQQGFTTVTTGKEHEKATIKAPEGAQSQNGVYRESRGEGRRCQDD